MILLAWFSIVVHCLFGSTTTIKQHSVFSCPVISLAALVEKKYATPLLFDFYLLESTLFMTLGLEDINLAALNGLRLRGVAVSEPAAAKYPSWLRASSLAFGFSDASDVCSLLGRLPPSNVATARMLLDTGT